MTYILSTIFGLQVNFLTKLVALKPGKTVHEMIRNVMLGKDEGEDSNDEAETTSTTSTGVAGRVIHNVICFFPPLIIVGLDLFYNHMRLLIRFAGKCDWKETSSCSPWHVS